MDGLQKSQRKESLMESMVANDETLGQEETLSHSGQVNQSTSRRTHSHGSQPTSSHGNQQTGSSRTHTHANQSSGSSTNQTNINQRTDTNSEPASSRCHHRTGGSNPSLGRGSSYYTPYMEDRLCRELKFFFMGPHEKITAKRKCPWKLIIQILKIFLVTAQLIQFGYSRSSFVEFTEKTTLALENIYLKDWQNTYETMPYPPAIGKYALYRIPEIVVHVNHAMEMYDDTEKSAIASLKYCRSENNTVFPMQMCVTRYKSGYINDTTNTYDIDSAISTRCYPVGKSKNGSYDIIQYMKETRNITVDTEFFDRLLILELQFSLKSFRLDMNERAFPPQLYRVDVKIKLDDSNKDGQMLVTLKTELTEIDAQGHMSDEDAEESRRIGLVIFDSIVMLITVTSIILCSRSVIRGQKLKMKTIKFFKKRYNKELSFSDRLEFLNLWYVTIIINDLLTIIGSGYKIQLETRNLKSTSNNYDVCGLMLGTGSLLAWLGVLRYIGFFNQFNILIVTLKKAFPNMLRFLTCCIMLYIGFVICGWVVLGPYHIKFRQMSTASECLFSLINGDDMFVTFSATVTDNQMIWYYSRFYLYIFISLFIYAVLNLFIAVIMDTYETIKEYYEKGFPKSELFQFIDQCQDPAHSPIYRREDSSCNPFSYLCCCCRGNPDQPNEFTSLIQ